MIPYPRRVPSSRSVLPLAVTFVLATLACAACAPPPPIKTSSGEHIGGVSYEERFPLSNDSHDTSFHGDRLRRAVEMMDRAGVIALS
ncbi:MAG: hypothetical protein JWP87_3461, partial [Labilithrix sp.]|nr:hypothetical protein [Labilithrix sp.]